MRDLNHTINILANAYLKGEFEPMNACCCTVGNIVADANGFEIVTTTKGLSSIIEWKGYGYARWAQVFSEGYYQNENHASEKSREKGLEELKSTGYTVDELKSLEDAMFFGMSRHLINHVESPKDEEVFVKNWAENPGQAAFLYKEYQLDHLKFKNRPSEDEIQFEGLMAVVDRLFEIHGVVDEQELVEAKRMFDPLGNKVIM